MLKIPSLDWPPDTNIVQDELEDSEGDGIYEKKKFMILDGYENEAGSWQLSGHDEAEA